MHHQQPQCSLTTFHFLVVFLSLLQVVFAAPSTAYGSIFRLDDCLGYTGDLRDPGPEDGFLAPSSSAYALAIGQATGLEVERLRRLSVTSTRGLRRVFKVLSCFDTWLERHGRDATRIRVRTYPNRMGWNRLTLVPAGTPLEPWKLWDTEILWSGRYWETVTTVGAFLSHLDLQGYDFYFVHVDRGAAPPKQKERGKSELLGV
ncbi:hypothetical protein CDD83_1986 [Cordyceps sp. RAO-2017]|nr:hypothetical protein CDD83_1986 [Cordyceps sp. RAO-2017]